MQFSPGACTRSPGQQANRFSAVAERQNEQPGPAILAALRIAHHRTAAVVDLRFFSRSSEDDACWFRPSWSAQLLHEALHRLVAAGKAVLRYQVLPDCLAVPVAGQSLFDQLAVLFTGTSDGRFCWKSRLKIGGHLFG